MVEVDNSKSFMKKNEKTISWIAIIIGVVSLLVYGLIGIIAIILGYWIFKQKTYKTNGEIAIVLGIAGIVLSLIWGMLNHNVPNPVKKLLNFSKREVVGT